MAGDRAYRGVPADERRSLRRRLLVETVLDCLRDDGLAGVSVRSVCARAPLTARYFYESFDDLDQLLLAAVDSVFDEIAERSTAAMISAAGGTEAQVRAAIDAGFGVVANDPRKANAVLVAAAGHGPLRARRQRLVSDYADLIIDSLPVLRSLGSSRRQARATALFLMGGSADVIEAVLSGRLTLSRVGLVDLLTTMWLGALSASLSASAGGTG